MRKDFGISVPKKNRVNGIRVALPTLWIKEKNATVPRGVFFSYC
jgi:hypothetical protein